MLEFTSKINLEMVRKEFNLKIQTKTQNKNLDLIIKSNEKLFLCEAKHINTSGGGQDKQMSELIELLNIKENNKDFYIISFLDGKYSNKLLDDNSLGKKISTQRNEIINYLKNNKNNYWLNTKGFRSLFEKL
ncbi:MAG: DpnII family type II restriction endonuclease [Rickettsiales bacterium]